MTKKIVVRSDANLNPELANQIQTLRGGMASVAEQQPIPARFTSEADPNKPAFIITDTLTGRQTTVALYAYREVRQSLTELFA